ncbi:hypothetical protein HDU97_001438 [Phlyctochytrium planicorne]|nr:hypothetical protein HDU97_001438 [Phlyctochytrium planicorne]
MSQLHWRQTEGKIMPPDGIQCGTDGDGTPLYAARVNHDGGLVIGKASHKMGMVFSFMLIVLVQGGKEYPVKRGHYEILCGPSSAIEWVPLTSFQSLAASGQVPIEGGKEQDGHPLYIGQAFYQNGVHVGKCGEHMKGVLLGWGGKEVAVESGVRIACVASSSYV